MLIRGGWIEDVGQVVAMPPSSRPERVSLSWSSEVRPCWFGRGGRVVSTLELPERTGEKNFLSLGTRVVSEAVESGQLLVSKVQVWFDKMSYDRGKSK